MDDQNVFQNGFEDSLGAAVQIDKPDIAADCTTESTSDSISNSLSGLCIPKQEPMPTSPLPPQTDPSGTSFLRQALLGEEKYRVTHHVRQDLMLTLI